MRVDTTFTLDCFDVVNDVAYLSEGVHYDGIVIGGSRSSTPLRYPFPQ